MINFQVLFTQVFHKMFHFIFDLSSVVIQNSFRDYNSDVFISPYSYRFYLLLAAACLGLHGHVPSVENISIVWYQY